MCRLLSALFFVLAIASSAAPAVADDHLSPAASDVSLAAAPAGAVPHRRAKAPADEYFGHLKMSVLGMRNVISDVDLRADAAAEDAARNLCHKLVLAEDALRDWQGKYPDDDWIPKLGYALLKDYEKVDAAIVADDEHVASSHAIDLATWLEATYPNSEFAPK
jgi:hypothetical protein